MLEDHLEKLIYFKTIAKRGSFSKAAKELYITQPTLTKSMNTLEDALEQKLFIRTPKGIELTEIGTKLFHYSEDLFLGIDKFNQQIKKVDPFATQIKIGTYESISIYFWPHFIKYMSSKYPQLELEIISDRSKVIIEKLENNEIDLSLSIEPKKSKYIHSETIYKDNFAFYMATNKSILNFNENSKAPIIYMPNAISNFDKETIDYLNNSQHKSYKTNSLESIKAFTENGIGIGLLPTQVANELVQKKKLKKIKHKELKNIERPTHGIKLSTSIYKKNDIAIKMIYNEISNFFNKKGQ